MRKAPVLCFALPFTCLMASAKASDFVGTWVGKWDNSYCVQFTVTDNANTGEMSVLYEWQENVGKPLQRETLPGLPTGRSLKIGRHIEFFASLESADQAVALGHFSALRAVALVREPTKRCNPDGPAR